MTKKDIDVLILDDDVDLLTSVAELLADCGYRVKGFADPESAVEFAVDQTFAVGLFDFMRKPVQPQELIDTVGRALAFNDKMAA